MELEKSALYIVGTPIGNLSDITFRAVETLRQADFIAAEDTRVTAVLLNKYGIKNSLVSCREHNIASAGDKIIRRLTDGENCAYVTDAGTPAVSDPGAKLVRLCAEKNIPVFAVPGPSAVTAALALSGLDVSRFCFEGFLSVVKKEREYRLNALRNSPYALVFCEAPHKLKNTLADLLNFLGERNVAVCREMTKIHEEVIRGRISDIIALYEDITPKGEFVLVVEKAVGTNEDVTLEEAARLALNLKESGVKLSDAVKIISGQTGLKRTDIYKKTITKE